MLRPSRHSSTLRLALFATAFLGLIASQAEGAPLDDYGITVSNSMPPKVRDEILAGVAALPPAMRRAPGPPLHFDWTPEAHEFAREGSDTLAPLRATTSTRAGFRLEALSADERERLWWRRAVVAANVARWDRRYGWSKSQHWHRVALWEPGGLLSDPEPRSHDPWSFSRPEGRRSPHLDLIAFAEEAFVPASALVPDAVATDAQLRCQDRSKWRFLFQSLARAGLAEEREHGSCPAFDRWADLEHLQDIEVLMVKASSRRPESLFGHLMLRPIYDENAKVRSRGFQTVVQLVALTSKKGGSLDYMWRGISGDFPMVILTTTLASIRRTHLELEQRSVRRYRLALTSEERERVLDRVWDLEHHGTFRYKFFSSNCAAALLWLVDGALDAGVRIETPAAPWVMPGAVLDAISRIEVKRDGQKVPLLSPVPGTLQSTGERARWAHQQREALVRQLPSPLRTIHRQSLAAEPERRRRAYERLPTLVEQSGAPRVVYDWLALTATIERYMADRAVLEQAGAGQSPKKELDAALRLRRRRNWLREDPTRVRRPSALVWSSEPDPSDHEAPPSAAEETFYRFTELQAQLVEKHWPDLDGRTWLARSASKRLQREAAVNARSLPRSGAGRSTFALGVSDGRPAAMIATSPLRKQLGDVLGNGYSAKTEVRLLDGNMILTPGSTWPEILQAHMTFVALRTIERDVPQTRTGLFDEFGWGAAIEWDRDELRRDSQRFSVEGELLLPLSQRLDGASFTALSAGIAGQARFDGWDGVPATAVPVSLLHRTALGGSFGNGLRLEASWQPAAVFRSLQPSYSQEARGRLDLDLVVGSALGQLWIVGPSASAAWLPDSSRSTRWQGWLRLQLL